MEGSALIAIQSYSELFRAIQPVFLPFVPKHQFDAKILSKTDTAVNNNDR